MLSPRTWARAAGPGRQLCNRWSQQPAQQRSSAGQVGHSGHLPAEMLRNQHDLPKASSGMSHKEKYLFDLNGFLVLRSVLSQAEVAAANDAVDAHMDTLHERTGKLRTSGLYGRQSEALAGDGSTGRKDMGGMLGWAKPHCEPFRQFMCHPRVVPILTELLGVGYRLDHSPLLLVQEQGAEGHTLHGGAVTESGEPAWPLMYSFSHGQMRNQLLTVCMQLRDAGPEDGGFCVVPGSHKSNFPVPPALADVSDEDLAEHVRQPAIASGDVLVFTEAVLHGTLPWTADHQRRTVIYRFAPPGSAYGRGYHPQWPAAMLEGMTPAQLAVMEAPYHPRMNRVYVDGDGNAKDAKPREPWKVEFDEKVFGNRYF
eukprot:TRINITY_DN63189_c0_g1_i1.p1 TRINITY_DN63189_c0_g1~~TRINITY_DN63189_c0_g1_i1.p1  ORF type:complete len:377 (+),score=58.68 TRINITY_DN63189_c0_g1_i1:27-1133(+)